MLTGVALVLGLAAALSTRALHPSLRTPWFVIVPLGVIAGWLGETLLAPLWAPVVNDVHAASVLAAAVTAGILFAIIAAVGYRILKARTSDRAILAK